MVEIEKQTTIITGDEATSLQEIGNRYKHRARILNVMQLETNMTTIWSEGQRWAPKMNPDAGIILLIYKEMMQKALPLSLRKWLSHFSTPRQRQKYQC